MLAVLGLVLDGGRIYFEKRRAQAAADSGAMAAAQELRRSVRNYDTVRVRAVNDTALNGYSDANSAIDLAFPPSSGPYSTNQNFAEVMISRSVPTTFMRMVGVTNSSVAARAVAGLLPDDTFCIYALDLDTPDGFKNNGTSAFEANCGIMVNSIDSSAFRGTGTGACTKASVIAISGSYDIGCVDSTRQTTPKTGVPAVPDPLSHVPEPDWTSMPSGRSTGPPSNRVYQPGVYSAPIHVSAGQVATFLPGIYVLQNGLNFTGGTITGTDVMFYNLDPGGNKPIRVAAGASVDLDAPGSGPYMGILFFGARTNPYKNPAHNIGRGSATSNYTGTFYFPNEHIDFAGTPTGSVGWTIIVARTMNVSGTSGTTVVNPPPPDENPLLVPVMVE